MSITALEGLLKSLRDVLIAVAEDLGDTESLDSIELVDFKHGSTALVIEQPQYDERPTVLDTTFVAMRARSKALPLPAILTNKSFGAFDSFDSQCTLLALRGTPVYIELDPEIANDTEAAPEPVRIAIGIAALPRTESEQSAVVEESSPSGDREEREDHTAPVDSEPEWDVRFSGTIRRLDRHDRKLWIDLDDHSPLFSARLTQKQFDEADADQLRWKHVVVLARATQPNLAGIQEILELELSPESVDTTFEPATQGAEGLSNVVAKIQSFLLLPEKWDSYNARPISRTAVNAAISFLATTTTKFAKAGLLLQEPFAAPISSGAVQLEWERGDRYLEVEFRDMRDVHCLRGADGFEVETTESRKRAAELVQWLHSSENL